METKQSTRQILHRNLPKSYHQCKKKISGSAFQILTTSNLHHTSSLGTRTPRQPDRTPVRLPIRVISRGRPLEPKQHSSTPHPIRARTSPKSRSKAESTQGPPLAQRKISYPCCGVRSWHELGWLWGLYLIRKGLGGEGEIGMRIQLLIGCSLRF
ncbi:hypothetical protein N431DRAFT_40716 [Stipitochalara longipes BDJ]|nr:hypothetical protein N431DRAFT_40716 [Stipitochalara longipes BDJ]